MAGYLAAGFLVCAAQMLPANEHFLQFEAHVEADSKGNPRHRILPGDRVWLALMHSASGQKVALGDEAQFDPDGSFEFRYRKRRQTIHHETHE